MRNSKTPRASHWIYGVVGLALLQTLAACVPLVVGTVTVTAIDTVFDRRSTGRNIDDNTLELKLKKMILTDPRLGSAVNVTITAVNGLVLLTGETNTKQQSELVGQLAKDQPLTRKVVNELAISGKTGLTSRVSDSWITAKIKTKLLSVSDLPALSMNVTTERGRVYLLGLVTQQEAELAVSVAKTVRGVTHIVKVFEYVK